MISRDRSGTMESGQVQQVHNGSQIVTTQRLGDTQDAPRRIWR